MNTALAPLFSLFYRHGRRRVINRVYTKQERESRPHDLEEVVEIGDEKFKRLPHWAYTFPIPENISVQFYDLRFPSPLTLAAFKDDLAVIDIWMRLVPRHINYET
ncbi:MAG TPA: hypothetical protein VJH37_01065 [Candidatus Nanoarchaeia archaeon]|nr:hypothetical protein [Candidatus Nanoarchaeia archaeon]